VQPMNMAGAGGAALGTPIVYVGSGFYDIAQFLAPASFMLQGQVVQKAVADLRAGACTDAP